MGLTDIGRIESGELTPERATAELGFVVPEIYILIAKSIVAGFTPDKVAEIYGLESKEIIELNGDSEYQAVYRWVAGEQNRQAMDTDELWDTLESKALGNLRDTIVRSKDPELNLKVAALANKAHRRTGSRASRPLDAGSEMSRVAFTMTKRMVAAFMNPSETRGPSGAQRSMEVDFEPAGAIALQETLGIEIAQTAEDVRSNPKTLESITDRDAFSLLTRNEAEAPPPSPNPEVELSNMLELGDDE